MRDRRHTVFVIAPRVSTVRDADLILVLEDGRIAARCTHEQLQRESALYNEIVGSQLPGVTPSGPCEFLVGGGYRLSPGCFGCFAHAS